MDVKHYESKIVRELVKSGKISVNSMISVGSFELISVLQLAIMESDHELVDFLLENGTYLNAWVSDLGTALHVAIEENNLDIVKKLIHCGADVNFTLPRCSWLSPLSLAIELQNSEITDLLITAGANIHAKQPYISLGYETLACSVTALNGAIINEDVQLIEFLLKKNVALDPGCSQDNLVSSLQMAVSTENLEVLQLLQRFGAQLEIIKDKEFTPEFREAVKSDNIDVFKLFVRGIDNFVDIRNLDDECAAYVAVEFGSCNILRYLLDCGTKIDVRNTGYLTLMIIAIDQWVYMMQRVRSYDKYFKAFNMVKEHAVKLSCACLKIEESTLKLVEKDIEKSWIVYEKEIYEMKRKGIYKTNIKYYSVLKMDVHSLAIRLTSVDYSFDENEILMEFPLYGGMIFHKLQKALQRKELVKNSTVLYNIFYMYLPNLVVRHIYHYLGNDDLKCLVVG